MSNDTRTNIDSPLYLMRDWNDKTRGFIIKFNDTVLMNNASDCLSYSIT